MGQKPTAHSHADSNGRATATKGNQVTLVCITNETKGVRGCRIRGQHGDSCPGDRYGRDCEGCVPRPAEHGLLCWGCWERVQHAWARWHEFTALTAGIERAVQRDNTGSTGQPSSTIPLTLLWLAIDECERYLKSLSGTLDDWVARVDGAKDAILFAVSADIAYRSHPIEEKPHRLKRQRCPKCSQQTLVWHPPQYFGDHVRVACSDAACGQEMDQRSFETLAMIEGRRA